MTNLSERDAMAQLADTAERLRAVRRAHGRFLALWAVDHLLTATADRLGSDNPPARLGRNLSWFGDRSTDDEG